MEQLPNELPVPEIQALVTEQESRNPDCFQRAEQASHLFNLEQMTSEQVLQLSAAITIQANATEDDTLLDGLSLALSRLPEQNLTKAHELMTALVLSDNHEDHRLAADSAVNLLWADDPGRTYEDPNGCRAIQLWLKLALERCDKDFTQMEAMGQLRGQICSVASEGGGDKVSKTSMEALAALVLHMADLIEGHHPYLRYKHGTLSGGILGQHPEQ